MHKHKIVGSSLCTLSAVFTGEDGKYRYSFYTFQPISSSQARYHHSSITINTKYLLRKLVFNNISGMDGWIDIRYGPWMGDVRGCFLGEREGIHSLSF